MTKVKQQEVGKFGLIQLTENGIKQIGVTQSEYDALELILAGFSKERPLTRLPEEYDLILKNQYNSDKLKKVQEELNYLKSLIHSDSVFWALRHAMKNPSDFDFEDIGYVELYNYREGLSNK